ncbi:MAG: FapA family protein [Chloroflexota bacterium]
MDDFLSPDNPTEDEHGPIAKETAEPEPVGVKLPAPVIKVTVSQNKLQALLTIRQEPPTPYQATVDDVYQALAKVGVKYGILKDKIQDIISHELYPAQEIVAEGQKPQPGEDGSLEYLFSRDRAGQPQEMGYRVDHYNLSLTKNVIASQVLVRRIPAIPGQPGTTVTGRPIPAPKVHEARLPVGKGTKISETNPLELIAGIDGFVRLNRKSFDQVIVEQVFDVFGDVDMSTGYLDVEGAVHIRGDVQTGFKVKATGDIIIDGLIKSCQLEAGGSIHIKGGGIGGLSRATLKAGDDIVVKFVDQADLTAGGSIAIADEALDCTLQAEETIKVGDEILLTGSIVGGRVTAGYEIRVVNVGNANGIRTRLRVGERPSLLTRRQNMQTELQKDQEELSLLQKQLQALTQKQSERALLRESRRQQRAELEQQQQVRYEQLQKALARLQAEGLLVDPDETIAIIQSEIQETRHTLERIELQLATLIKEKKEQGSVSMPEEDNDRLGKLALVRQGLLNKLAESEILLAKQKQQLAKIPRSWWRELELARTDLETVRDQIAKLEVEDALDQKIERAIPLLQVERNELTTTVANLEAELEALKQEIAATMKKKPRIIVSGKLWAGAEVNILGHMRQFNTSEEMVRIELTAEDEIITTHYSRLTD